MEIPNELVEKIANYLALKPYNEVAILLSEIQKATQAHVQKINKEELKDG